ncbi:class I SAM-dependent methyltransferase [Gaopeijia maritima]|uniref:class I SAM-dependent methyltransferase n=1 Tax=Gaopeijia maritima TaxID=3119007 RepID=UPI00324EF765
MTPIDFGLRSRDYALHRHGPPQAFYERLQRFADLDGARVLDLATGPGTVAFELARRGATVTGIDVAEPQIAAARARAEELGLDDRTSFRVARAEATGAPEHGCDLVTSGQSWHWFDAPATVAEVRRVLRPGGMLAIVAYSYLSGHCPVSADTEELILQFNPDWPMAGWTGLFPRWVDDVVEGGMTFVEQFCWDYDDLYSHDDWRGRIRTCNGVGSGGLPADEVARFDAALAVMLRERYPDPVPVRHRLWAVMAQAGGA